MRKLIAVAIASLMVAGMVSSSAVAGKKKKPVTQHVEGTVLMPQPYTEGCIYRAQRTLFIAAGEQINGIVGHTFEVDPKTAGLPFKLEVSAGSGFDISFYADLGDPTDPTTAPANSGFETAGPGGEKGTVPAGMPYAFVCMTEGSNASFMYMAGK